MADIVILGSGAFGIAIALTAHSSGNRVTIWSAFQDEIDSIRRDGEHKAKLPGVKIPPEIAMTTDISVVSKAEIIVFGVPSQFIRSVAAQAKPHIGSARCIVNTGKGIDTDSLTRLSEVISSEIPNIPVVALSGPSHAEEAAVGIPTAIVAASECRDAAALVQDTLSAPNFRIYISDDIIGCELGGALKNIIALCAGICDGLGYGDNTKAALMTRGMAEISHLGTKMGARLETFSGLTGLGDLVVTCTSMHSRNRRAGILIGQGISPADAISQTGTVEGYVCCKSAYMLAKKMGIEMPITESLYSVLFEDAPINDVLPKLMSRPKKHEVESCWLNETEN